MPWVPRFLRHVWPVAAILLTFVVDAGRFLRLWLRSPAQLAAENLFLRKQLALYQERHVKPRRGIVKLLGMILSPGNSRHFPDEISTDLTVRRPSPYR
jgi:hypothetical protein